MTGLWVLLSFLFPLMGQADHIEHTVLSRQNEIKSLAQSTTANSIPGFVTDNPPETALNEVHALEGAAERAFETNKSAQHVKKVAETRQYFVLDGGKDPIFKRSQAATQDPEAYLQGPMMNRKPRITYEKQTCREAKPKTKLTCSKILMSQKVVIEPEIYEKQVLYPRGYYAHEMYDASRHNFIHGRLTKIQDETVRSIDEKWSNGCHALQKKETAGVCRRVKIVCPKGEETREVTGEILKITRMKWMDNRATLFLKGSRSWTTNVDFYSSPAFYDIPLTHDQDNVFEATGETKSTMITRPCWRYEETYECSAPSLNNCEPLRQASCEQMGSRCFKKIGEECVEWEQDYRCPKDVLPDEEEILLDSGYEMPEVDKTLPYTPNQDMNDAIAKLSMFQEIQKGMRQDKSLSSITVFRGSCHKCTLGFANFKNCCTNKGWGNLESCETEEKELQSRQKRGLCAEVGSYCSKKFLGVCTQRKRSSCCFPSKLSRIIHEQGRPQLGIGWGDAKAPNCRGFSPEELARLDFDRLNLSELFEEIATRAKQVSANVVKRNMTDRIQTMTDGLGNQTESGDF